LLHGASPDEAASTRGPLPDKIQDVTYGFLPSLNNPPFIKEGMAGPYLFRDRFSDGEFPARIAAREVPQEMVPIHSTIFRIFGYFLK